MTSLDHSQAALLDGHDYVLRISTPYCNLKCRYCLRDNISVSPLPRHELIDIIRAAAQCGIRRLRWTGGEPTITPGFLDLVSEARELGIEEQMLSTNGTTLSQLARSLHERGITRVNISLDTLDRESFYHITGHDMLDQVLDSIHVAADVFALVKINRVLEHANLEESVNLIEFVAGLNRGKSSVVIRFIELVKGGFAGDEQYVRDHHCGGDRVIEMIRKKYGSITPTQVAGDNPMCYYYSIESAAVTFGIVPNFSVHFQCGGKKCKKLRVNPTGFVSNCSIYQKFGHDLRGRDYAEKLRVMRHLIIEKQQRTPKEFAQLKHYQSDYQFWRFGKPAQSDTQ